MADADAHRKKIANLCRFCCSTASKKTGRPKNKFKDDFERYFGINVDDDNDFIHPPNVCQGCVHYFYRLRESPPRDNNKFQYSWEPHKDNECICTKDPRGRPTKKRKRVEVHEDNGSETESGEEAEDLDLEKDACRLFHRVSKNLHKLDRELAVVLCKNICSQFGLLFVDPEDMFNSIRSIDRKSHLKLVGYFFS